MMQEDKASPLHQAYNLVHGDRGASYGDAAEDFDGLATLWTSLLGSWLKRPLTGEICVLLMQGLKLHRQANNLQRGLYHHDSNVDTAGYVEVMELVHRRHIAEQNDTKDPAGMEPVDDSALLTLRGGDFSFKSK